MIKDVHNLTIENNEFYGQLNNAIKLAHYQTRGTDNVIIQNNYFHDTQYTAVFVREPNTNTKVLNNVFERVTTVMYGPKQHAIYIKGPGFLVEGNVIIDVPDGHGISVRTSGIVRGNFVKNALENGINYYSDSPEMGNGELIIENNVVIGNNDGGIEFNGASTGGQVINRAIVRFNTFVNNNTGIRIQDDLPSVQFELYGNIIVEENGNYYEVEVPPILNTGNLTSTMDIGFVDLVGEDFQLTENASALDYVTDIPDTPPYDYLGNEMGNKPYDAGAYQSLTYQKRTER